MRDNSAEADAGAKMSICILTTVHPAFDTRIFHKQAKTLVRAGYDVTLIAQHDKDEVVDGIKIIALPKPRNRFTRIFGLTWRAFRLALRQHADIYHFHDPELLPVGILLKLLTRSKVIYDVHEDYPKMIRVKYWIPKPLRYLAAFLFERIEVRGARALDAIVTVNEVIARRFRRSSVEVVKNYPVLQFSREFARPRAIDTSTRIRLVYVGAFSWDRGLREIIQAVDLINEGLDVELELIGRFKEHSLLRELRTIAERCKAQVKIINWVPYEKVWKFLRRADIGLMCLHPVGDYTYSLPVKLFEYMAAGLPIIASNFPLWENFFKAHNCGLTVDPLNPEEIARAIEYLINHPDEARQMGENGRRAVLEKYNWESEGKKLLALYEEVLSK